MRSVIPYFAGSDLQALGVLKAAREARLRVPEDLSLVGFDHLPIRRWATPALTTVRQPLAEMAAVAVSRRRGARRAAAMRLWRVPMAAGAASPTLFPGARARSMWPTRRRGGERSALGHNRSIRNNRRAARAWTVAPPRDNVWTIGRSAQDDKGGAGNRGGQRPPSSGTRVGVAGGACPAGCMSARGAGVRTGKAVPTFERVRQRSCDRNPHSSFRSIAVYRRLLTRKGREKAADRGSRRRGRGADMGHEERPAEAARQVVEPFVRRRADDLVDRDRDRCASRQDL